MQSLHQTLIFFYSMQRHRKINVLCPRCSQTAMRLVTINNMIVEEIELVVDHDGMNLDLETIKHRAPSESVSVPLVRVS